MSLIWKLPLRIANSVMGFWWYLMERVADWLVSAIAVAKTEYVRKGKCNRCGRCCRLLALEVPRWAEKSPLIIRIVTWWHINVLNFDFYGQDRNWLVYRCRYFRDIGDEGGGKPGCRIYPFRHRLCRYYPKQRLFGHPKLHSDCGFSFVRRDGKLSFDETLRKRAREDR